jgi:hypothetical protein
MLLVSSFLHRLIVIPRYYYKHDPLRISTCPTTVHALLHIASSIREMGPVWAYWAFPMERYCGEILPNIRSRRYPYKSIDRYVSARAHLSQIKLLYNLHQELSLQSLPSSSNDFALPWCKRNSSLAKVIAESSSQIRLTSPKKASILPHVLRVKFTAVLGTRFQVSAAAIRRTLPKELQITEYGRVRKLDGGDNMQARELVAPGVDSRDMSFVRVSTYIYIYIQLHLIAVFAVPASC